jgi:hypothetical protein
MEYMLQSIAFFVGFSAYCDEFKTANPSKIPIGGFIS